MEIVKSSSKLQFSNKNLIHTLLPPLSLSSGRPTTPFPSSCIRVPTLSFEACFPVIFRNPQTQVWGCLVDLAAPPLSRAPPHLRHRAFKDSPERPTPLSGRIPFSSFFPPLTCITSVPIFVDFIFDIFFFLSFALDSSIRRSSLVSSSSRADTRKLNLLLQF